MRLFLLAALLFTAAFALPQGLTPRSLEGNQAIPNTSNGKGERRKAERQIPPKTGMPIVQSPGELSRDKRKAEVPEKQASASDSGISTLLAVAVAVSTIVSGISAALQVRIMREANRKTDLNLELTRKAAEAAEESAKAAIESTKLTRRALEGSESSGMENLALSKQLADAATLSAQVADQSLGLYERPWVMFLEPQIQHRNLSHATGIGGISASNVYPRVTNSGRSPALMRSVGVLIIEADELPPAEATVKGLLENQSPAVLTPGSEHHLHALRMEHESGQGAGLFIVTAAEYADLLGKVHRSVSVWGFDPISFRFLPLKAPDYYEYT